MYLIAQISLNFESAIIAMSSAYTKTKIPINPLRPTTKSLTKILNNFGLNIDP